MFKKTYRWIELNVGWFFVNGFKRQDWEEYLQHKYFKDGDKRLQ
jgi:hypothetical protein